MFPVLLSQMCACVVCVCVRVFLLIIICYVRHLFSALFFLFANRTVVTFSLPRLQKLEFVFFRACVRVCVSPSFACLFAVCASLSYLHPSPSTHIYIYIGFRVGVFFLFSFFGFSLSTRYFNKPSALHPPVSLLIHAWEATLRSWRGGCTRGM